MPPYLPGEGAPSGPCLCSPESRTWLLTRCLLPCHCPSCLPPASSRSPPFPLPRAWAACHRHMPGSSVSGPPAPLGHERKLMPTVSPGPAAASLGATVAPDLLSANNPTARKGERRLGLHGPGPGLWLQVGAQLVAASPASPLRPGNLRRSSGLGVRQSVGCRSMRTEAEVSGKDQGLVSSPQDWLPGPS